MVRILCACALSISRVTLNCKQDDKNINNSNYNLTQKFINLHAIFYTNTCFQKVF